MVPLHLARLSIEESFPVQDDAQYNVLARTQYYTSTELLEVYTLHVPESNTTLSLLCSFSPFSVIIDITQFSKLIVFAMPANRCMNTHPSKQWRQAHIATWR
jgi:hypothetical protein